METHNTEEMIIPVNAEVRCTDGTCGHSVCVLVNPVTSRVTDVVVREAAAPHPEFIVPLSLVAGASTDLIRLRCTKGELSHLEPFTKTEFVEEKWATYLPAGYGAGTYGYGVGTYVYWPYVTPATSLAVEHEQIPPGELVIRRGTRVEATDGTVGRVDEFLVHPDSGNITHLVMREGHLWGQKDVSIPVSAIRETRDKTVFLNLDKQQVESLPTIPIHRRVAQGS